MSLPAGLVKTNYHTHTYLCRHANGNPSDYVKKAIELGFEAIGISDHAPFSELADRSIRMRPDEYPLYLKELKESIDRYKDSIRIYKGLEIEYLPNKLEYYKQVLCNDLDYLALGQHYVPDPKSPDGLKSIYDLDNIDQIRSYTYTLTEAMDTGLFKFICHPDIMLFHVKDFDEDIVMESKKIIAKAIETKTPLEINANGIRMGLRKTKEGLRYRYPRLEFWKLVSEMKPIVIVSADAHDPSLLYDEAMNEAYEFARQLGIEVEEDIMK